MPIRERLRLAGIASIIATAAMGAAAAPGIAAGETVRYPSATCPDTGKDGLSECIDRAVPGSTVVLVDEVIDEHVTIRKSVTLRSESRAHRAILSSILIDDDGARLDVTIKDVRVRRTIRAEAINDGSGHRVTIQRVEVGRDEPKAEGIRINAGAPMTLVVEESRIRSAAPQYPGLWFYSSRTGGESAFRAVGNRIDQAGSAGGGAGIEVSLQQAGSTKVVIHSNSVFDVAGSRAGYASGIVVYVKDSVHADVDVVGNTVARSATSAFVLGGRVSDAGRVRLDLFDNTFTHSSAGISLSRDLVGRATIRTGSNNLFRNELWDYFEDRGAGPGDMHRDPRFVALARGDLRLRASSPLIDQGRVCQSGGLSIYDAAGHHRLHGRGLDIGAFEHGSGRPSGVVRFGGGGADRLRGTSGRDVLCGMGGSDTLCAKDGKGGDWVDGGSGRDKARTDAGDTRRSVEATAAC